MATYVGQKVWTIFSVLITIVFYKFTYTKKSNCRYPIIILVFSLFKAAFVFRINTEIETKEKQTTQKNEH